LSIVHYSFSFISFGFPMPSSAALEILSLTGLGAGLALLLTGLRRSRIASHSRLGVKAEPALPEKPRRTRPRSTGSVEVIRLSGNSSAAKAAVMTQQQKIAAALAQASVSPAAVWEQAEEEEEGGGGAAVQVANLETSFRGEEMRSAGARGNNILLISGGAALAGISFYVLLHLRHAV
jgi:hypothetical protein